VAQVTDNEHQLRASTQQIKTLKNIFSGILIALFSPLETYHNDTRKENEK
jgi:hypothetical protein